MAVESSNPFSGILNAIPGYRGYRSKEDRRDADRRVRERVAAELAALIDRVETVARAIADKRQLTAVGPVDDLAKSIRHLQNRVATATYGYGGLFGDRDVDEQALDQIRQFDESLLEGDKELEQQVAALEQAHKAGEGLTQSASDALSAVSMLNRRFDTRANVIETAKPAPPETIASVLALPTVATSPAIYDLHERDAVTIGGENYLVDARIDVQAGPDSFRLFRLNAAANTWLFAPITQEKSAALLTESADRGSAAQTTEGSTKSGTGAVISSQRKAEARPVSFTISSQDGNVTVALDWQSEVQAFSGKEIAFEEIEVFPASNQPS